MSQTNRFELITGKRPAVRLRRLPAPPTRRAGAVAFAVAGVFAALVGSTAAAGSTSHPGLGTAGVPTITIMTPRNGASYERGSRIVARFRCSESGTPGAIVSCHGTIRAGHVLNTRTDGSKTFAVTATDSSGTSMTKTVHYDVWTYVNPLRAVPDLRTSRIDMGVDYSGSGPILAIGAGRVVAARYIPGPEGCWGRTCAPAPGGWVVYQLLDGPFAGKYVYAVENITVKVKTGQLLMPGQEIAVLHNASPNLETGWAAGRKAETLAMARHHECSCTDPGGWSSIEGRNFDALLVWLGAPSGYLQETPAQKMPRGWPALPRRQR